MANLATINNNLLADSGIDPLSLIVGTGTVNYIAKFSAEETIANSIMYDSGSRIGIGTITPGSKLHISGTNSQTDSNSIYEIIESTDSSAGLLLKSFSTAFYPFIRFNQGATGKFEQGVTGSGDPSGGGNYYFNFNTSVGATSAAMLLSSSGFLGVGTIGPAYKLQVYTDADVWHLVVGGATGQLRFGGQNGSGAVIQAYTPGTTARLLYLQRDGSNVIINGTTDTGERLQVNGNTRLNGTLTVTNTATFTYDNSYVILNRSANDKYIGVLYRTAAASKWFVGLRELINDNYYIYNEVTSTNALTISSADNNAATFSGNLSTANGSITIKTTAFGGLLNLQSGTTADNWQLYHYSLDNTLRFNYNGAGGDEFILNTVGDAIFSGSLKASISALSTAATLFVVSDSGTLKSRTAAQVLSDIGGQAAGNYVTLDTTQTITGAKTVSRGAATFTPGGTLQSFLIDGATQNGALTINSNGTTPYAYMNFAQGGVTKFEMGIVGTSSDGSLYINRNIQVGEAGASIFISKTNGRVGILNIDPQYSLDVTGNIRAILNQNALTRVLVSNTTAGVSSYVETTYTSDSTAGGGAIGKYSSTTTSYKIVTASNTFLYNGTAGDIAILNDFATGAIKMAAGGSSSAHFTIASTGAATFANNLFNNGLFRTSGTTNTVKYNSGTQSLVFGSVIGDSGSDAYRVAYFRGNSTAVSTWYGGIDGNGDNVPYGAIDAIAGNMQFFINPGGTGGGNFTLVNSISSAGTKLDVLSALGTAATTFLVSDSKVIKTRTAAQVLSDIGAQAAGNYVTLDTTQTITGKKTFSTSYGDNDPIVAFVGTGTDTFQYLTTAYNASLGAGKNACHFFGRGSAGKNSAYIGFQYNDANSNTNFLTLGLYGVDHVLKIYGSGYSEFNNLVGIGKTPSYKLDVYTDADVWHAVFGSSTGQLRIGGETSDGAVIQAYTPGGTVRLLYLQRDGSNVIINGTTDTGDRLQVNGTATVSTRLGIGATSATYSLQLGGAGSLTNSIRMGTYLVAKNTRQYIGYTRADSGLFESSGNGDTPSTVMPGVVGIRIVNTEGTVLPAQADNSVQILTHIYNGNSRVALHASYSGYVGINGIVTPAQALHVEGTIRQTGVTSSMLKTNASGDIIAAVAGTDYQAAGSYVTTNTTQTITGAKTISREANTYGGTVQSFLIDGAAGNGALTINAAADYAYLNFAQAGVTKWEIGTEGAATNKGSLYFNHNIQTGSAGAAMFLKKSDGNVGINNIDPQRKLHVSNAANGFISRFTGGTSSNVNIGIYATTGGSFGSIGTESDHAFNIYTNAVDRFFISNVGNATFSKSVNLLDGSINIKTTAFGGLLTLEAATTSNTWHLYHYNPDNTLRFNYNGAGGDEFILTTGGNVSFSGSVTATGGTINGALTINRNTTGLVLNRDAVTNYNGIYYSTAGTPRWFIGLRENLSSNNYICYSEQTATDVMTLNLADNSAKFAANLSNNGLFRTRGSSNTVYWSSGSASASFGAVLGNGDTANRTAYFRGSSSTEPASVWWGYADANGNNVPVAALDGNAAGGLGFWSNSAGTGGGSWTNIMNYNITGLGVFTQPSFPLHVYTSGDVWHVCFDGGTGQLRFGAQTSSGAVIQARTSAGATRSLYLNRDGGEVYVNTTTDAGAYALQVAGSTYSSTGFFESSDIRLKDILNKHESVDFGAIEFKWNDGRDSKLHWGYAAQEVMKWLPDAVSGGGDKFYTLDYTQVHTYKIAMLEKRIAELEQQLKNK